MSTAVAEIEETDAEEYSRYKALSAAAVATLILGILSLMSFLYVWFVAIPIVGLLLGIVALKKIRANPEELTGEAVAKAGLALCVAIGIAGPSYLGYVYATEVPEWATRISYAELQPDPAVPGQLIPPSAAALNGKKVFIKGFIYPGGLQTDGIKQFVLCRDQGDCCFGGNPKITDRIEVTLTDPLTISLSTRMFKVAGTFRIEDTQKTGLGAVYYHLDAEYVQ
jgi:hypothetical protein